MARIGGFGGGLSPFGNGSLGGFGQYNIGQTQQQLADLALYQTEVRWGNGQASNGEYLAALRTALSSTDPGSRDQLSAQNKLDDAEYRIGRADAERQGMDALIAFEQAWLARAQPDSLKWWDISDSLDALLAQRRSRDYGKLVDEYNAGRVSTERLQSWVSGTLQTISPEDPDFENWRGVQQELADRILAEEDEKVYQDYQQGRIKGPEFLAHLTKRRDSYSPESPKWDDWNNRLEDATVQAKNEEQAATDAEFFRRYESGKVSDTDYLKYLRDRIAGMGPDDPQLSTWKQRLSQAAYSLAEDQLRFDVERGKRPVSALVTFYRNYRTTLNPGSAEWRQVTRQIDALAGRAAGGGGGGRRMTKASGGGKAGGGGGTSVGSAVGPGPKVIDPKATLSTIMPLLSINANAPKGQVATAVDALELNLQRLGDARQRGDEVWAFQDPRRPGQMIQDRDREGNPVVDAKGKPVMIPGSAWLPTSDEAFANILSLKADYQYQLAGKALRARDAEGYFYQLRQAGNTEDRIRLVGAQYIERSNEAFFEKATAGIELAMRTADWANAINLATEVQDRLDYEMRDPSIDRTRIERLERMQEKIRNNPLLPQIDPATGQRFGGAIDLEASTVDRDGNFTNVVLRPGWHHVLDRAGPAGTPEWGLVFDDRQDGTWEAEHISVSTSYGNRKVTGEVTVRTAPINPQLLVNTPEGSIRSEAAASYISFVDENGALVKAYSIDGQRWIRSLTGAAPTLELDVPLTQTSDAEGVYKVDAEGRRVFTQSRDGWIRDDAYFAENAGALAWYGERQYRQQVNEARSASVGNNKVTILDERTGRYTTYTPTGRRRQSRNLGVENIDVDYRTGRGPADLGAPGQKMQLIFADDEGTVDLTPRYRTYGLPRQSADTPTEAAAIRMAPRPLTRFEKDDRVVPGVGLLPVPQMPSLQDTRPLPTIPLGSRVAPPAPPRPRAPSAATLAAADKRRTSSSSPRPVPAPAPVKTPVVNSSTGFVTGTRTTTPTLDRRL